MPYSLQAWPRVAEVAKLIAQIVETGPRTEVIATLAILSYWRVILAKCGLPSETPTLAAGPELLTCREAAADLKLNTETVRVLCRRKELPCVHLGRSIRIRRTALEQFKRERMTVGQSVPMG